jgi:hypothetical protein
LINQYGALSTGGGGAGLTGPGAVWGSPPGREPCSPGQPCGERPVDSAPEPCSPLVAVGAGPGSGPPWDVRKVFEPWLLGLEAERVCPACPGQSVLRIGH